MDPTFTAFLALLTSVPGIGPALPYVPLVCGAAAIADVLIPPPPANSAWVVPRRILHYLALNFGYARNALPAGYVPVKNAVDLLAAVQKSEHPIVSTAPASPGASPAAPAAAIIKP